MPSSAKASADIYTLSLHDALPIWVWLFSPPQSSQGSPPATRKGPSWLRSVLPRSEEHTSELQSLRHLVCRLLLRRARISTLFPYTTLFRSGFGFFLRLSPARVVRRQRVKVHHG